MELLLQPIRNFLRCETPKAWLEQVPNQLHTILIDHANCELKAAQAAVRMLKLYGPKPVALACLDWIKPYEDAAYGRTAVAEFLQLPITRPNFTRYDDPLVEKLVMLIREELHHFHQVLTIMAARQVDYPFQSSSRYAPTLHRQCRTHEPARQVDMLIVGAYIEARSCERFAAMIDYVDDELAAFYWSLLRSEARHFEDYLALAQSISDTSIATRVQQLGVIEAELIKAEDDCFRFHSGSPTET
ncbi:tRNA-(ms[2]io[6]A)-hydroxylase [Ferrimonas lipolytica]